MTTIKHTLCDTHNINLRRICTYKKKPYKKARLVRFLQEL